MTSQNISYWLDMEYSPRVSLAKQIESDVAIIGGGITGVSAAYHCAKSGLRTVLIEKDIVASGSAGKNGGMVVEGMEIDFHEAVDEFGPVEAKDLWMNTVKAREYITSLIQQHQIDCDFSQPGSLYVSVDQEGTAKLKIEAQAREAAGIACEKIPKGTQLKKSILGDALFNPGDCLLHPVKFVRALARAAEAYGAQIYEHTPALKFGPNEIITPGSKIIAKKVVIAMESANPSLGDNRELKVIRSQAIVTQPVENLNNLDWNIGGMLWVTGSDYLSCRKIGDRIFSCKSLPMEAIAEEIAENIDKQKIALRQFFPDLNATDLEISHQWTGLMVETSSRRPYIKESEEVYEVGGHSGNGLTNGVMIGKVLAESFLGKKIPSFYERF